MDSFKQRQNDLLEPIYNSSVPIQDVVWKTFREWWTIEMGGKRGSGRSMLAAGHDYCTWNDPQGLGKKIGGMGNQICLVSLCNGKSTFIGYLIPKLSLQKNISSYICLCLPLDRTWHKINDPKVGLKWGFWEGEGWAWAKARTLLVINPPSAMWAWWA